jgi:sarcosine oxidase, subunit beta
MRSVNRVEALPSGAEVVVIGGGVIGAATAFFASRAGMDVVVLERRPAVCTLTTAVAGGGFRLQQDNERDFRMVEESVEIVRNFADLTAQRRYDPRLRPQGYLWLTTTEEGADRQHRLVERQRGWGLDDVELLDGDQARSAFPFLAPEVRQARFRRDDGFLDPKAVTMGFFEGSGAAIKADCGVVGLEARGSRPVEVRTTDGVVEADAAVIAAGPFSGVVGAMAGVDLPVTAVRRHRLVLPDLPQVPSDAPMTIDEETGTHWRPAHAGAAVFFTDPTTPPSPPAEDVPLDHSFLFSVLDPSSPVSLSRISPFWREVWERGSDPWYLQAGQYTMTPDRTALIGPAGDGVWVNTGYCGHGVMCSGAGGRHLADLLSGKARPDDNPYRLDREFVAAPHLDPL